MSDKQLEKIRQKIDAIDSDIYRLIKQRAEIAAEVAKIKQKYPGALYYRPEREAQILRNIIQKNDSLLSDRAMAQIFRDIMTACLALQKKLTIAYLGPEGSFCQMASEKHYGKSIASVAADTISDVFHIVESQLADYGVVPIENSSEGTVSITLDALLNTTLQIIGEIHLPIHHQFLHQSQAPDPIEAILSHQQSLAQCRQWIAQHYPGIPLKEVSSNSAAAMAAAENSKLAAISSELSAELYNLNIIHKNIEDYRLNTTRFIILGRNTPPPSGHDKTSLLISSPHKPGSLIHLLKPFEQLGINMISLESRPYKHRNWNYVFFIDIEGHQQEEHVQQALQQLSTMSVMMTVLGSYPKSIN